MEQSYKVFIGASVLSFSNKSEISPVFNTKLTNPIKQEWMQWIDKMETEELQVTVTGNTPANWKKFGAFYQSIEAAGGLVKNQDEKWLIIYRNDVWDLPKGKLEPNEDIKECAVREVAEECGIQEPRIVKGLHPTYHTYTLNGQRILKKTLWYLMESNDASELVPQTEEGITDVRWVNSNELLVLTKDSYGSIKDVVENGVETRDSL